MIPQLAAIIGAKYAESKGFYAKICVDSINPTSWSILIIKHGVLNPPKQNAMCAATFLANERFGKDDVERKVDEAIECIVKYISEHPERKI